MSLIVKWNRSGKAFLPIERATLVRCWLAHSLALPGTEACDAGGGAFGPEWKEGPVNVRRKAAARAVPKCKMQDRWSR